MTSLAFQVQLYISSCVSATAVPSYPDLFSSDRLVQLRLAVRKVVSSIGKTPFVDIAKGAQQQCFVRIAPTPCPRHAECATSNYRDLQSALGIVLALYFDI